jgi:hypothetical protein
MDTPDPKWPGQANIAINFQILFYAGAERSIASGDDGAGESSLAVLSKYVVELKRRSLS